MDELEFYNGQLTGEEIDKRIVTINCGTISSLPATISNTNILAKHVPLQWWFGNPTAQIGAWTVTTSAGNLTISGTISGTTTLTLALGVPL